MNVVPSAPSYAYTGSVDAKVMMYGKENFLAPLYEKFGPRFFEYRKEWDRAAVGDGYLPDFPLFLDMEPEYKCNLRCLSCPHQFGSENPTWIPDRMSVEAYRRVCEEGKKYGLPAITVSNNNEGLTERYLFDYVEAAASAGVMDIFVGTNGHLLTREMSERILDSGLTRLLVSIDAATAETYKATRVSDKFDMVVDNIKQFYHLRKERGQRLPLLRVSMVLTTLNSHEEQAFKDMWAPYADIISIQRYIPFMGDPKAQDNLIIPTRDDIDTKICSPLWQRMSIRANGDVIACCHLANKLKVGNINDNSVHEIWHSEGMKELRHTHLSGKYADIPICKSCMG